MASFFEKLKRGMGIEEVEEETMEKEPVETIKKAPRRKRISVLQKETAKKPRKLEIKQPTESPVEKEEEGEAMREEERPSFSGGVKEDKSSFPPFADAQAAEGQLAIDVYQTEDDLVVQSAIAGVRPENLDIVLEKDILSIKGLREKPFNEEGDYFSQECYWGPFSREIILPAEVNPNQAKAQMKEGVLTIRIPKILREKKRKVVVTS